MLRRSKRLENPLYTTWVNKGMCEKVTISRMISTVVLKELAAKRFWTLSERNTSQKTLYMLDIRYKACIALPV